MNIIKALRLDWRLAINLEIAKFIDNHNSNVCWCDLVLWAYGYKKLSEVDFKGRCKVPPYFDENWGGCYCGKHMTNHDPH